MNKWEDYNNHENIFAWHSIA